MRLDFWRRTAMFAAPDTPLDSARYVVLDTELTSLDKQTNRLLSVGALAMDGGRIRLGEQFYRVVNPGVDVPAPGVLIHGLRPADVAEGASPADVLEDLRAFIGDAVLVGHFVTIDLAILRKEHGESRHVQIASAICTARVHGWMLRNLPATEDLDRKLDELNLAAVARHWQVESRDAHHALGDAWVTALIWQRMLHTLKCLGVRTLGDLERTVGLSH